MITIPSASGWTPRSAGKLSPSTTAPTSPPTDRGPASNDVVNRGPIALRTMSSTAGQSHFEPLRHSLSPSLRAQGVRSGSKSVGRPRPRPSSNRRVPSVYVRRRRDPRPQAAVQPKRARWNLRDELRPVRHFLAARPAACDHRRPNRGLRADDVRPAGGLAGVLRPRVRRAAQLNRAAEDRRSARRGSAGTAGDQRRRGRRLRLGPQREKLVAIWLLPPQHDGEKHGELDYR